MKPNILKTKSTRYAIFHLMSSFRIQLSYLTMICVFSCLKKIWQSVQKTLLVWGCVSFEPIDEKVDKLIQTFPKPQVT